MAPSPPEAAQRPASWLPAQLSSPGRPGTRGNARLDSPFLTWSALGPHSISNRWSLAGTSGHCRRVRIAGQRPSAAPTSDGEGSCAWVRIPPDGCCGEIPRSSRDGSIPQPGRTRHGPAMRATAAPLQSWHGITIAPCAPMARVHPAQQPPGGRHPTGCRVKNPALVPSRRPAPRVAVAPAVVLKGQGTGWAIYNSLSVVPPGPMAWMLRWAESGSSE
jgi:hypothetical protein